MKYYEYCEIITDAISQIVKADKENAQTADSVGQGTIASVENGYYFVSYNKQKIKASGANGFSKGDEVLLKRPGGDYEIIGRLLQDNQVPISIGTEKGYIKILTSDDKFVPGTYTRLKIRGDFISSSEAIVTVNDNLRFSISGSDFVGTKNCLLPLYGEKVLQLRGVNVSKISIEPDNVKWELGYDLGSRIEAHGTGFVMYEEDDSLYLQQIEDEQNGIVPETAEGVASSVTWYIYDEEYPEVNKAIGQYWKPISNGSTNPFKFPSPGHGKFKASIYQGSGNYLISNEIERIEIEQEKELISFLALGTSSPARFIGYYRPDGIYSANHYSGIQENRKITAQITPRKEVGMVEIYDNISSISWEVVGANTRPNSYSAAKKEDGTWDTDFVFKLPKEINPDDFGKNFTVKCNIELLNGKFYSAMKDFLIEKTDFKENIFFSLFDADKEPIQAISPQAQGDNKTYYLKINVIDDEQNAISLENMNWHIADDLAHDIASNIEKVDGNPNFLKIIFSEAVTPETRFHLYGYKDDYYLEYYFEVSDNYEYNGPRKIYYDVAGNFYDIDAASYILDPLCNFEVQGNIPERGFPYTKGNILQTPFRPVDVLATELANSSYRIHIKKENKVIYSFDLEIIQMSRFSTVLDEWDGRLTINEEKGYVLSNAFYAGENTNGVLVGQFEKIGDTVAEETKKTGVFGFKGGKRTFSLDTEGDLQLGDGNIGIKISGDAGVISANTQGWSPIYEEDSSKVTNIDELSSGTYLDLSKGVLCAKSAYLTGDINAESGSIGGWEISKDEISSGKVHLNSNQSADYAIAAGEEKEFSSFHEVSVLIDDLLNSEALVIEPFYQYTVEANKTQEFDEYINGKTSLEIEKVYGTMSLSAGDKAEVTKKASFNGAVFNKDRTITLMYEKNFLNELRGQKYVLLTLDIKMTTTRPSTTISTQGKFTCQDGVFKGSIDVPQLLAGDVQIADGTVSAGSYSNSVGISMKKGTNYAFWAGGSSLLAPFRVGHGGETYVKDLRLPTTGSVSGLYLQKNTIGANGATIKFEASSEQKSSFPVKITGYYLNSLNSYAKINFTVTNPTNSGWSGDSLPGNITFYAIDQYGKLSLTKEFTTPKFGQTFEWSLGTPGLACYAVYIYASKQSTGDEGYDLLAITPETTGSEFYVRYVISTNGAKVVPSSSTISLGSSKQKWKEIWCEQTSLNSTSDRNEKNTIAPLEERYSLFFDKLKPVSYKFNDGTSGRTHIGLVAQDVEEALAQANLTSTDFAGLCYWDKEDGERGYGLRYGEFISLAINEIQKLKARINELEKKEK